MEVQLTPAVRYWEMEPHRIASLLQELKNSGSTSIGAWVPWAHLESDRRQTLKKFMRQVAHFDLKLRLVVTPEVSVGYANGGIPEDLLRRNENLARDRTGQTIYACAPPNIHPLVNLNAPQVFQRYGHFLMKLAQEVADLVQENFQARVELIVGDSFFKHYFTSGLPLEDHGDFASLFFQKELDFMQGWTPAQAERMFCVRALDFLNSRFERSAEVKIYGRNFFMKSVSLDRLVDEVSGAVIDPECLFQEYAQARARCDALWFHDLNSVQGKERTFLISSALALYGDLWLPIEDYLATTQGFRQKMAALADSLSLGEQVYDRSVLAIVQNRFAPARISQSLAKKLGTALQLRSSLFELSPEELGRIRMLVVEEALRIEYEQFQELLRRARAEKVTIAIFRSSLCKRAVGEVNCLEKFKFSHGWTYEVSLFPSGGHMIIIDGRDGASTSMDVLAERLLAVAGVEDWCSYNDSTLTSISVQTDSALEERIVFFLNPGANEKELVINFKQGMELEGIEFVRTRNPDASNAGMANECVTKFPPYGVVPLRIRAPEKINQISVEHFDEERVNDGAAESLAQV